MHRNTVNVLFPTFLAEDLHGTNNIDNCGVLTSTVSPPNAGREQFLTYTKNGDDGVNDCADGTDEIMKDTPRKTWAT